MNSQIQIEEIALQISEQHPEAKFYRHKFGVDLNYYVVRFHDKIQVEERSKTIYHDTKIDAADYYLTRQAAIDAISQHLNAANEKFAKCLAALQQIQDDMAFEASYFVDGDTYGTWDRPIISFQLGGFDFTFSY